MQIAATELKSLIKRLAPAGAEFTVFTEHGLTAMGSDIAIAVEHPLPDMGLFQVNARKLSSVVSRISGTVSVQKIDNALVVKSAKASFEIETAVVKPRKFEQPETLHTLPLTSVRELLKYVASAADPNKAAMQGGVVQLETVGKVGFDEPDSVVGLDAMGTDGKRAAWSEMPFVGSAPFKFQIPLPAVAAIQSLEGETVEVGEAAAFYFIRAGKTVIYANRLAKTFPNLKAFVPKVFAFQATIDAAEFKQVLHTVEPMLDGGNNTFPILVHFLDGKLTVKTVGKGGKAEDELTYVADPLADVSEFKTKVSHKLLSDYFALVQGEVVFNANPPVKNAKGEIIPQPMVLESGNRKIMIAPVAGSAE